MTLSHSACNTPKKFQLIFPFPSVHVNVVWVCTNNLNLFRIKKTVIGIQKHPCNPKSLVSCVGASSDCRYPCSFPTACLTLCMCAQWPLYFCTSAVIWMCAHLIFHTANMSIGCKEIAVCFFSLLNCRLSSTRERTTCFCSLNMYVVKYVMLFISCK